ncbi:MAG: glycoside hydrolase family 38 N-terminal domain-containing protein [Acidimicrobiales bacterium]
MTRRKVAIVPHTHWDREWYLPYQSFRLRLVQLLDDLLPRLEADPSYARFMLDGQMAVVDDYLEVRPEAEPRLRRLAASGRLTMGPWYILMDEFLVSGETIVRDLQLGMERASAFGGAMPVGYLPDMFGHVAQMPQLLRQAGFEHAVVWRGVPSTVDRTAFWWSSPDGSTVRAEHLWVGYGNGAATPDDAKALVGRIHAHEAELGDALPPDAPMLWMNGMDHQPPQPWLGRVVAEVNDLQEEYHLAVTSLPEYLAIAPTENLPRWTGELRSGARANLLMGVGSNRVDVKQAAARTERALERLAEPWCALLMPPDQWPERLLAQAWREVVRNSAHDSVCACSADEVGTAVLHRYDEARAIAEGLASHALRFLAASVKPPPGGGQPSSVVINASSHARSGLAELVLPGEGAVQGAQTLIEHGASVFELRVTGRDLSTIVGQLRSQKLGQGSDFTDAEVDEDDEGLRVVLRSGRGQAPLPGVAARINEVYARAGARRDDPVQIRMERAPFRKVLVRMEAVPGFGWKTWRPGEIGAAPVEVAGADLALDNSLVRVEVDPGDGTFAIGELAGLNRLVDDGDAGDTYNWSPPAADIVVEQPEAVRVEVLERGPLRARLLVHRSYRWPERVEAGARTGGREVQVETTIELRAGERLVRIQTSLDNVCRDHRFRAWFPLPRPARTSRAECAFAVVERGLSAEGGPHERALPTWPSRRFVCAGGLTVLHEGLLEYELVDIDPADGPAHTLALTLLRCTGRISGADLAWRPLPAGPPTPVEGPQMAGRQTLRYALQVDPPGHDPDPYALADDAFLPLEVVTVPAGGQGLWPEEGSRLGVTGAQVAAVRRVGGVPGTLEVRVFNPTPEPAQVLMEGRSGWLVDLRGRPLGAFDGGFALGPWAIATAHLGEDGTG